MTEVGAVLVGGGELHDRWESLLRRARAARRAASSASPASRRRWSTRRRPRRGRAARARRAACATACSSPTAPRFDRRVLAPGLRARRRATGPTRRCCAPSRWPAACTRSRASASCARWPSRSGSRSRSSHRALADAETCARVFCALFPRLCANAATIGDALALLRPARPPPARAGDRRRAGAHPRRAPPAARPLAACPTSPASTSCATRRARRSTSASRSRVRTRARAHFAPSSPSSALDAQAETVDCRDDELRARRAACSSSRLIRRLRPPGNARAQARRPLRLPALPPRHPVPGARGRARAGGRAARCRSARCAAAPRRVELSEQLDSLFGLRHCGRGLPRRQWPSAYGQMGRCLSPCLGDLDPNLYRRRLDEALALFCGPATAARALLAHVDGADARGRGRASAFERAAWLRRRRAAAGRAARRASATRWPRRTRGRGSCSPPHPRGERASTRFWLVDGRVADWGPLGGPTRRGSAPRRAARRRGTRRDHVRCRPTRSTRCGSSRRGWRATRTPALDLDQRARSASGLRGLPRRRRRASDAASACRGLGDTAGSNGSSDATASRRRPAAGRPGAASRRTSASAIGPRRGETTTRPSAPDLALAERAAACRARRRGQAQPAQVAVGLAPVVQARDGLLADVAALGEATPRAR